MINTLPFTEKQWDIGVDASWSVGPPSYLQDRIGDHSALSGMNEVKYIVLDQIEHGRHTPINLLESRSVASPKSKSALLQLIQA